jgi:hypothetical protein
VSYKIEFTLSYYDGKWVSYGLTRSREEHIPTVFGTVEQARKRCLEMGPVYFTCGGEQARWRQRILDAETGEVVEYVHDFDDIESETESE